jgi:dephospho-CoA kinase
MLNKILAISGKPGLYRFLSKGNKMIIVESIDDSKRRLPAYATDKIVALSDISIYTNDGKEVKLADVFNNAKKLYDEKEIDLHYKKASQIEIVEVFSKILPQYDKDRVHVSDMRKVIQWYNILTKYSLNDFSIEETAARNEESE